MSAHLFYYYNNTYVRAGYNNVCRLVLLLQQYVYQVATTMYADCFLRTTTVARRMLFPIITPLPFITNLSP
jgi:hypothetical protein